MRRQASHDKRSHRNVRDEMSIHHIHMDPVRAGRFNSSNLFAETCKIRGENGGGNNIFIHQMRVIPKDK